ncbi:MAG TPA: FG-GAP-like repeat-containing protein, partial [bacterium]
KLDLALAQGGTGSTVFSILRNTSTAGSLSFEPQVAISVLQDTRDVAAGDLDGDGRPDLALSSWEVNALTLMRNADVTGGVTAQSFQEGTNFTAGTNPVPVLIADFDLDGKPDVAVGNFNGGNISVFRNAIAPSVSGVAALNPVTVENDFQLFQNHPNPFNTATLITYKIRERGRVLLRVFDTRGYAVNTLIDREQEAGSHEMPWNGKDGNGNDTPSGVYFFKLDFNGFSQTMKTALLK